MKITATRYLKGSNVWSSHYKPLAQFTIVFENISTSVLDKLNNIYSELESIRKSPIVFQNDQNHTENNSEEKIIVLLSKIGLLLQPENNQLNY